VFAKSIALRIVTGAEVVAVGVLRFELKCGFNRLRTFSAAADPALAAFAVAAAAVAAAVFACATTFCRVSSSTARVTLIQHL
jgi:hypothetical protein